MHFHKIIRNARTDIMPDEDMKYSRANLLFCKTSRELVILLFYYFAKL